MASVLEMVGDGLVQHPLAHLSIQDQGETMGADDKPCGGGGGVCVICLDTIELKETALIKGCEHAYWYAYCLFSNPCFYFLQSRSVTCILRWVTYSKKPTCPQCKNPFDFLNIHRSLDGSIHDYMFEESVCLLLRATWFKPLSVESHDDPFDEAENFNFDVHDFYFDYDYDDEDDDLDEEYASSSASLRIGNRRWGDNGYVRAGRQEARPVRQPNFQDPGAGSSREPKMKEPAKDKTGRRAKRTLKREAANKAAAEKHELRLVRLGRK